MPVKGNVLSWAPRTNATYTRLREINRAIGTTDAARAETVTKGGLHDWDRFPTFFHPSLSLFLLPALTSHLRRVYVCVTAREALRSLSLSRERLCLMSSSWPVSIMHFVRVTVIYLSRSRGDAFLSLFLVDIKLLRWISWSR